jgi:hypothetical protein
MGSSLSNIEVFLAGYSIDIGQRVRDLTFASGHVLASQVVDTRPFTLDAYALASANRLHEETSLRTDEVAGRGLWNYCLLDAMLRDDLRLYSQDKQGMRRRLVGMCSDPAIDGIDTAINTSTGMIVDFFSNEQDGTHGDAASLSALAKMTSEAVDGVAVEPILISLAAGAEASLQMHLEETGIESEDAVLSRAIQVLHRVHMLQQVGDVVIVGPDHVDSLLPTLIVA